MISLIDIIYITAQVDLFIKNFETVNENTPDSTIYPDNRKNYKFKLGLTKTPTGMILSI